jgi:hypothetical protein
MPCTRLGVVQGQKLVIVPHRSNTDRLAWARGVHMLRVVVACVIAASAGLTAGCSTVRSTAAPTYQVSGDSAGLTYFLPMRMVRVTATRAPLRLEDLNRAKAQKQAELTNFQVALREAKQRREQAQAVLAALDPSATNRQELQEALGTAQAEERVAQGRVTASQNDLTNIQAAIDALELGGAACTYTAKLEALAPQADPDQRFIARLTHNSLRDDTLRLNVTPAGLLSTANLVAVDRTADIIVEAAGAFAGLRSGGLGPNAASEERANCASLPRQFVRIIDPLRDWTDPLTEQSVDAVTLPAITTLNQELSDADFPFRISIDPRSLAFAVPPPPPPAQNTPVANTAPPAPRVARRLDGQPQSVGDSGAIFYRSAVPVTFTIGQRLAGRSGDADADWQPVDAAALMLPQAGPVTYIPMNSSPFVRTVNDVQFADGSISSWSAERPSEVLEVVRLPVRVLTALISVPAQLFQLRVNYSTEQRNLAQMQRQQIEQDERLRALRDCIAEAESNDASSLSCFD